MSIYYNTCTRSNPLATTRTSRFAVRPATTCEQAAGHSNAGRHNLNSSTCPDPGCPPFDLCLAFHLPLGNGYPNPKKFHYKPGNLSNPSTPGRAEA